MADIKYYDVILRPVITEKSMNMMGEKKYAFCMFIRKRRRSGKGSGGEDVLRRQGCFGQYHEHRRQEAPQRQRRSAAPRNPTKRIRSS